MYDPAFTPDLPALRALLERRGFTTSCYPTATECLRDLNRRLDGVTIGFGGSQTVRDMGLFEALSAHNDCFWHWDKASNTIPEEATRAEVYICSLNAVAQTGELVNIDGGGNRLSSNLYGHKKVIFVVGTNKITPDYDSALWRARNIAAPKNAARLGRKTPCVTTGRCHNCSSPERICAALLVYWEKPALSGDIEVAFIEESCGF